MIKAIIFFLASLGILDGDHQDNGNETKDRIEVDSQNQEAVLGATGAPESDSDDDDNKHSTKEGL